MTIMAITSEGGRIYIDTPYNPHFVARVKALGARWDASRKQWYTDDRNIEAVREAMRKVYGQDDRPAKLVSVRVRLAREVSALNKPVTLFGRTVASATGRDSGARIGMGVAFEARKPLSGGSMKNWRTVLPDGAIIVIHDLPETAVAEKLDWDDEYGTVEVIADGGIDRNALKSEKAALLARLTEIDKLLQA